MTMYDLFRLVVKQNASDLFISVGAPPSLKIDGQVLPIKTDPLTPDVAQDLVFSIMSEAQRAEFELDNELNFAVTPADIGRFRINVFRQRNHVGLVARRISSEIPSLEALGLPVVTLEKIAMTKIGLVLFVGGTGTGKTTTQAAMVGYRNQHTRGHIITIEDPIEFVHDHIKCIVDQREVGVDTESFDTALVNAMRQAPDLIQIGEIRDSETLRSALVFADTGHLCFATLHATNAYQALERIITLYPGGERDSLLMDLSMNLCAVVSQRLVPRKDGSGHVAAVEILRNLPWFRDLITKGEIDHLQEAMERSSTDGVVTFDQSLYELHQNGQISLEEALRHATSENNLRLRIQLEGNEAKDRQEIGSTLHKVEF
jgi:twitching motility protein PilU